MSDKVIYCAIFTKYATDAWSWVRRAATIRGSGGPRSSLACIGGLSWAGSAGLLVLSSRGGGTVQAAALPHIRARTQPPSRHGAPPYRWPPDPANYSKGGKQAPTNASR